MILDTSFLIDLMRADQAAIDRAIRMEAEQTQQRIASITIFELVHGIARAQQSERERETVEAVLGSKPVLDGTESVMRRAGGVSGTLAADGEAIDDGDAIITAHSLALDDPILTRNRTDFERIDEIEIETY